MAPNINSVDAGTKEYCNQRVRNNRMRNLRIMRSGLGNRFERKLDKELMDLKNNNKPEEQEDGKL